jgi:hypothetical protein
VNEYLHSKQFRLEYSHRSASFLGFYRGAGLGRQSTSKFNGGPSALRAVVILASRFPADGETRLRTLIREYIGETTAKDWPMMANRTANLRVIPQKLAEALQLALTLEPNNEGQRDRTTRNYDLT